MRLGAVFSRSGWKATICLAGMVFTPDVMARSAPAPSLFHEKWIDGTSATEPAAQVQALDRDTFVIRQSVKTNFEAPFLYLIFGHDKVLLVDTGAKDGQIRPVVDRLITEWLAAHHRNRMIGAPVISDSSQKITANPQSTSMPILIHPLNGSGIGTMDRIHNRMPTMIASTTT